MSHNIAFIRALPPTGRKLLDRLWLIVSRAGVSRLIWGTHAIFLLLLWGTLSSMVYGEFRQNQQDLSSKAELNARGFAEYVGLNVFVIDRLLGQLQVDYRASGGLPSQARLAAELGELGPALQQVAIADAQGTIVASTLPLSGSAPVSIADRPHFRAVAQDPRDRLFIGQTVVGRVSGRVSVQLVRPILGEGGRFQGAIVGSIDPTVLQRYFHNYDGLVAGSVVAIVGDDGVHRLRMRGDEISWGQDISGSPSWKQLQGGGGGMYHAPSAVDGIDRLYAFQHVGSYPLTVLVGYAYPTLASVFDTTLRYALMLAIVITLVLTALAFTIARLGNEQRRLIRQLRESRAKALEANQMKSNFLASVSHELRTPLNSILGFSELIREVVHDAVVFKYADLIHKSGKHLHALVSTILDLAKIEAGRMEVAIETVEMRELLGAIVDVHRVSADKKKLALSLTLPPQNLVEVRTDRTKFVQVLNNVLHNAIKFTQAGGIFVAGAFQHDMFVISVVDTGVGIPEAMLPRVFDRFNTIGEPSEQLEDRGSGLGLALSRELMELMGGTITIASEEGLGTQVSLFLPLSPQAATARQAPYQDSIG